MAVGVTCSSQAWGNGPSSSEGRPPARSEDVLGVMTREASGALEKPLPPPDREFSAFGREEDSRQCRTQCRTGSGVWGSTSRLRASRQRLAEGPEGRGGLPSESAPPGSPQSSRELCGCPRGLGEVPGLRVRWGCPQCFLS